MSPSVGLGRAVTCHSPHLNPPIVRPELYRRLGDAVPRRLRPDYFDAGSVAPEAFELPARRHVQQGTQPEAALFQRLKPTTNNARH